MPLGSDHSWLTVDDEDSTSPSPGEEYLRAIPHFTELCRDFDMELSLLQEMDLKMLMRVLGHLDHHLDSLKEPALAEQFFRDVFLFLMPQPGLRSLRPSRLSQALTDQLQMLRDHLSQKGALRYFVEAAQDAYSLTLQSRAVHDVQDYIRLSLQEGGRVGGLMLTILEVPSVQHRFSDYVVRAASAAHLLSDVRRIDEHHSQNRIAFKPGMTFRALSRLELLKHVAWLVTHHPNKMRAIQYQAKMSF